MRKAGSRLTGTFIPARMDGSGLVRLVISDGGFEELNMAAFPQPAELQSSEGGGISITTSKFRRELGGCRYRIGMPDKASAGSRKRRTISFQLGTNMTNETLFVLAKQLRDVGAPFEVICNHNGAAFRHIGLSNV